MKPDREDAYRLMHDGALALAEVEATGMRIDADLLERTTAETSGEIERLTAEQKRDDAWRCWRKRYGEKASMGSRTQLAAVLFEELGHESKKKTKTGRVQVDEEALSGIDLPFVKRFLKIEKLKKLKGTYLDGIRRELVGDRIHPSFNLHLVRTYRSSCDGPNVQNQIRRDEEFAETLRRCFVPSEGHVLVAADYKALEFKVAACFWKDSGMVKYASDPDLDIHRDMAAECYMLPADRVPKTARFYAKNQFVFPELYGSDYIACTRNLWNAIESAGLKTEDGVGLFDHLRENGVLVGLGRLDRRKEPEKGTFERHVKRVEDRFNARFPQWSERKDQWWKRYVERGWFPTMTGFVCTGVYTRNELFNYPIQGPAFHCLLWSLIRVVAELKRRKMRSRVVAQIHDELLGDVCRDELDDYLDIVRRTMTEDVQEAWPWIVVPLEVECEVGERNWFEKRKA